MLSRAATRFIVLSSVRRIAVALNCRPLLSTRRFFMKRAKLDEMSAVETKAPVTEEKQETKAAVEVPEDIKKMAAMCQPSVINEGRQHGAFLTAHIELDEKKHDAQLASIARFVSSLSDVAQRVNTAHAACTDANPQSLSIGVAFGCKLWSDLCAHATSASSSSSSSSCAAPSFVYETRVGSGELKTTMPATGGDLFFHVKADRYSQCFSAVTEVVRALRQCVSVRSWDEHYGFTFRDSRDLSGFIDGTENPATVKTRVEAALTPTGSSFLLTQKWVHDYSRLGRMSQREQEHMIGRTKPDSVEFNPPPPSSHVERMSTTHETTGEKVEIVRHSMPFGKATGESGLFFLAYSKKIENFDILLDRMVGKTKDKRMDHLFKFSTAVTGNYWYVPSLAELEKLRNRA